MWQLPQPSLEIAPGEVHLWRAWCGPAATDLAWYAARISPEEMERAARFATATLRRRYLMAHSLLHTLLCAYTRQEPQPCDIAYQANGKPYLRAPQLDPRLEFNMSHAGEMVVIAVGRGLAVGIDVELVRPIDDLTALSATIYTAREQAYLATVAPDIYLACFFRLWTRKEAWLKLLGDGLGRDPATVDVLDASAASALVDISFEDMAARDVAPGDDALGEKYAGALALAETSRGSEIIYWDARWQ